MAQELKEGGTLVSLINLATRVISAGVSGCTPAGGTPACDRVPGVVSRDSRKRTPSYREHE